MMNAKMKAVIIVIVIAVAAIAAAAIFTGGDDDHGKDIPDVAAGFGTVYGNADGNCSIDDTDLAIIESIMSGDRQLKDFPFADANADGKIDSADIEIVKDIMNKTETTVKVLDTQDKIVDVKYPVENFMVLSGSNLAPLMNILDVSDKVVAAAYNRFDEIRDHGICEGIEQGRIVKLTVNGTAADMDAISKLDTHTMFTEYGSHYDLDSDKNIKTMNDWGIDVLCMDCRDPGDDTRAMAVFGILLDRSEQAQSYIDFVDSVYKEIKDIEGDKFGTATALLSGKNVGLSGRSSGYTALLEELAGGKNVADWEESNKKFELHDPVLLSEKYRSDIALLGAISNYSGDGFSEKDIASYKEKYSDLDVWKNGEVYIYSTSVPIVCRVAYFAEALYPDLFEDGWANEVHQRFVDTYFDTPYKVDDSKFMQRINL